MSTVNYLTSRSSNLAAFNTIQLNVSTLTGSTIQTTATANTSSIIVSTLATRAATYSTLTGSTITTSSIITPVIATATGFTTIGQNTSFPNRSLEIGSDAVNTVYLDFHSSDSVYADYSTRIQSNGGSTIGQGHMMLQGSTINILGTSGVGIGTSNPTALLQVGAPNDISYANFTSSGAGETIYSSYATVPSISGNNAFGGNLNVFSSAAYARNSGGSITLGARMYNFSPSYYQFSPLARIAGVQDNTVDNYIGNLVMETPG